MVGTGRASSFNLHRQSLPVNQWSKLQENPHGEKWSINAVKNHRSFKLKISAFKQCNVLWLHFLDDYDTCYEDLCAEEAAPTVMEYIQDESYY